MNQSYIPSMSPGKILIESRGFAFPQIVSDGSCQWLPASEEFTERSSGRLLKTIRAVEKRVNEKGSSLTFKELHEHEECLEALREKAVQHVLAKGGFLKKFRAWGVRRSFDKVLWMIHYAQAHKKKLHARILEFLKKASTPDEVWAASESVENECINRPDENGMTALHIAVQKNSLEAFEHIIGKGALLSCQDEEGNNAFHYAVKSSSFEVAERMIQALSEDELLAFPFANNEGNSPFHLLAQSEVRASYVQNWWWILLPLFKKQKLSPFLMKNKEKKTPLHIAVYHEKKGGKDHDVCLGMMSFVFSPFMDISGRPSLEEMIQDFQGEETFLHYALKALSQEHKQEIRERIARCLYYVAATYPELFLMQDEQGRTPFVYATELLQRGQYLPHEVFYCCDPSKIDEMRACLQEGHETLFSLLSQYEFLEFKVPGLFEESDIPALQEVRESLLALREKILSPSKREDVPFALQKGHEKELRIRDANGLSPIHRAILDADLSFFSVLCDPLNRSALLAQWNREDLNGPSGQPLLHFIIAHIEGPTGERSVRLATILSLLVSALPNLVEERDLEGRTAIDVLPKTLRGSLLEAVLRNPGRLKFEAETQRALLLSSSYLSLERNVGGLIEEIDEYLLHHFV